MAKSQDDKDIFDRSFKQIMGSISSRAMVRFINGLFDSNHPLDSEVKRLNTEYIDKALKKRLCDETVSVGRTIYVIEEQTTDDANMAIRVFEYGYAQALHDKETQGRVIELKFPRMIVLYLEALASTPDVLTVRLRFPDSSEHDFNVKTVKLLEYSVEELLERGMAVLLPFYIVRLRKAARNARTEEERGKAETDFKNLALKLKEAIEGGTDENIFSEEDIATLLERLFRLVKYVGEGYKSTTGVRKMIKKSLMGYGQVLVLKGERKGIKEGIKEGKLESARNALNEGLSMEQAARITGIPTDELKKRL